MHGGPDSVLSTRDPAGNKAWRPCPRAYGSLGRRALKAGHHRDVMTVRKGGQKVRGEIGNLRGLWEACQEHCFDRERFRKPPKSFTEQWWHPFIRLNHFSHVLPSSWLFMSLPSPSTLFGFNFLACRSTPFEPPDHLT